MIAQAGVRPLSVRLLDALAYAPGSSSELAATMELDAKRVSGLLHTLWRQKFVRAQRLERNRGIAYLYSITQAGRERIRRFDRLNITSKGTSMKSLRVMDSSGDSRVEFDETSTAEAKALFERMTAKGAAVFAVNRGEGKPDLRVKDFKDLEQENVIVPAIVSG